MSQRILKAKISCPKCHTTNVQTGWRSSSLASQDSLAGVDGSRFNCANCGYSGDVMEFIWVRIDSISVLPLEGALKCQ